MDGNEIELYYDEQEKCWKKKPEPFCLVAFYTEEEYNQFLEMVDFWNEHHPDQE